MSPERSPATRALLFVAAVLAAVAFAVLVAGPLHSAILALGAKDWAFARTFRYLMLLAVGAVVILGTKPWRDVPPDAYGLRGESARPWLALAGALLAIVVLSADAFGQAAAGWITWDHDEGARKFWERLAPTVAGAVGIAILEEWFFRGWLFGRMSRGRGALAAALWTAVLFALPHAFQGTKPPRDLMAGWRGALDAIASWGTYVADPTGFLPKAVGLALLSLALTAGYLRTKSLWFAIGVHGGAHLFLQEYAALTRRDPEGWNWAGSKWLYDGVPAWALMAGLAWALWPRARDASPSPLGKRRTT